MSTTKRTKITFLGAGSTVFVKNILGDCMLTPMLRDAEYALYDIDAKRLDDSVKMMGNINTHLNEGRASLQGYLGEDQRREALRGADFVVNAVQIGGYKPSTVIDFEIPKKFGLQQTIADTLGIGGIFRTLRTAPVMLDFAHDMELECPDALMLNYTNPMAMLTACVLKGSSIKTVGLCHSVQACSEELLRSAGMFDEIDKDKLNQTTAGINHMGWLLSVREGERDLYPEIKARVAPMLEELRAEGGKTIHEQLEKKYGDDKDARDKDPMWRASANMTRLQLMLDFGYFVTESSEHFAEYTPWYIKSRRPDLIDQYNIPIDEYLTRCVNQIANWEERREKILSEESLEHTRSGEYGSYIMEAMSGGSPIVIGGNVMNDGLITNLPTDACVEVPCLVDVHGIQPTRVGDLPVQCAALNQTNINPQLLTVEAVLTGKRDYVYQAAMLDPHTAGELARDEIRQLCDELFDAHGDMMPEFK